LESIIESAEEEPGIELKKNTDKKHSSNQLKEEKPDQ
jgi:hypothetical protein